MPILKHKSDWFYIIGFSIVAMLINFLVLMFLTADTAKAEYAETYSYGGSRWKSNTICVHNKIDNPMLRQAVYDAVKNIRDTTDLHVINMGKTTCAGYKQVIYAVDNNYLNDSRMAYVKWNGHDWGNTSTGLSTYFTRSGVELRFNTRYLKNYPKTSTWQHIAVHELFHSMGASHRTDTCYSVVTMRNGCSSSKPTTLQTVDKRLINTIYSW